MQFLKAFTVTLSLIASGLFLTTRQTPAALESVPDNDRESISPAITTIQLSKGSAVVSGTVSTHYDIFQFEGQKGTSLTLDVDVTQILSGSPHADEDSQLYVLDHQGHILKYNDDETENNFESLIKAFTLPEDGTYYAVVTTFGNLPVVNDQNQVTAWKNTGSSHIQYDLLVMAEE